MHDLLKDYELWLDLSSDIQSPYQHRLKQTVPENIYKHFYLFNTTFLILLAFVIVNKKSSRVFQIAEEQSFMQHEISTKAFIAFMNLWKNNTNTLKSFYLHKSDAIAIE